MPLQFRHPDSAEIRRERGTGNFPWFALRVRSRHENTVATILSGKGYEWFVPLYKSRRLWSDRIKENSNVSFPRLCLLPVRPCNSGFPILTTPGVR